MGAGKSSQYGKFKSAGRLEPHEIRRVLLRPVSKFPDSTGFLKSRMSKN
jgi:hypothetical protein